MQLNSIVIASSICLLTAACGSKDASESMPEASVAEAATAAAVGAATGLDVSVTDLPDFVVLPKGSKPVSRMNMADGDQKGGAITLETSQTPAEVLAFYRGVMAEKGLKIAMENTTPDGAMLVGADEAQGRMLNVVIGAGENGKTAVTLTHGSKAG